VSATSESENRSVSSLGFPPKIARQIHDNIQINTKEKVPQVAVEEEEVPKDITEEEQEGESERGTELYRVCTEQYVRVT
jgi:hypothetical protein